MQKYLVLAGASGTGKSTIRKTLCDLLPGSFVSVTQHTTRPIRKGESPDNYIFNSKNEFDSVRSALMGKCNINGNEYGSTELSVYETRTGVIILNDEGLEDFKRWADERKHVVSTVIGVYRDIDPKFLATVREDRELAYVESEYAIYAKCDHTFYYSFENISVSEIVREFNFINDYLENKARSIENHMHFEKWCRNSLDKYKQQ
jgi:guanylate kinase